MISPYTSIDFAPGSVWLVGAGPGDPGLLTLHAVDALQRAEVVVYDALVSDAILKFIAADAVLEFAGKRGGRPSPSQRDITEKLITIARAGKRVVRLKGGDPFMFGRGGEEAKALAEASIPFRVIPGITAGLAGLAYAGIPATTRDTNPAIILATGHYAAGSEEKLDWDGIARTGLPIIVYMGLTHLDSITAKLIALGRPPSTSVAIVTHATLPEQSVLQTTLAEAAAQVKRHGIASPAIIAIGSIVDLRAALAPFQIGAAPYTI